MFYVSRHGYDSMMQNVELVRLLRVTGERVQISPMLPYESKDKTRIVSNCRFLHFDQTDEWAVTCGLARRVPEMVHVIHLNDGALQRYSFMDPSVSLSRLGGI